MLSRCPLRATRPAGVAPRPASPDVGTRVSLDDPFPQDPDPAHTTADLPAPDDPTGPLPAAFRAPVRPRQPPEVAEERESLEGWLDHFRTQVVLSLDGLPPMALRRRIPDTGPSLTGIVKYLTELERTWLVERWGERGSRAAYAFSYVDDTDEAFRVSDLDDPAALVGAYQEVCEKGRDALAGAESLDDAVRDDRRGHIELRWILLHLITETARRAGQAQALREVLLAAAE